MVVNRSLRKELLREIRNSRTRFLSIFLMVALGVMFLVGQSFNPFLYFRF